jgi:hypothetical protein
MLACFSCLIPFAERCPECNVCRGRASKRAEHHKTCLVIVETEDTLVKLRAFELMKPLLDNVCTLDKFMQTNAEKIDRVHKDMADAKSKVLAMRKYIEGN